MMPVNGIVHERGFQLGGFPGAGCPVVDAVDRGRASEPRLKSLSILPQIMQQPGQFGFVPEAEGIAKFFCTLGDVAQVRRQ